MRRHWKAVILLAALVVGVGLSTYISQAIASRNSSGTYSLPSGNPVVSGTPITSTWANNTMSDVGSELTLSLDRNGRGAMLAPLQCSVGTVSAPGLTFSGDTDTGLYRIGANNIAVAANGTKIQEWSSTTAAFPLAVTTAAGLTATQSTSNGNALTATGNGTGAGISATGGATGPGVLATGGATDGNGVTCTGTGNGDGVRGTGKGTGQGGDFVGGDNSGTGVDGRGGAPNGLGVYAEGTGTGAALRVHTGHAWFTGSNPASTAGYSNTLTPLNIPKVWGRVTVSAGSGTVQAGFNLSNTVTDAGTCFTVALTTDIGAANWAAIGGGYANCGGSNLPAHFSGGSGVVSICAIDGTDITAGGCSGFFNFVGFGAQ